MDKKPISPVVLNIQEVADYLGVSKQTIENMIKLEEDFPNPIRIGTGQRKQRKWRIKDLEKWIDGK